MSGERNSAIPTPTSKGDKPLLSQVKKPSDLRKFTSDQIALLAQEIREYLVTSVCASGGHLGPNLGVVELTLALHRVFNSPVDSIIFDTGHQAYVHKLLTGRQDFSDLRRRGGISGYPSRQESVHDIVENSHASTALSWADGISREYQRQGKDNCVVAVIGDGALTGGMAWEALNNIAELKSRRLIVVINDNGRSYAPTIGALAHHLDALRTSSRYEKTLQWAKKQLLAQGKLGEVTYEALHGLKRGVKDMLLPEVMFEELGLKYIGPFDGHDEVALEFAFTRARDYAEPVLVHVITDKGHGYSPAEADTADKFHAVGKIHPETGLPVKPSSFGWTAVFAEEMLNIAQANPKVVGITAAMMAPVGLVPMSQKFPDRVIDVGIAEQHAITAAAGMAFAGAHPVVALYATFANRAFDQMLMDVALHQAPVTLVLDRAGLTGEDGASHNGVWDIALFKLIPNLRVAAPRDGQRLRTQLNTAVKTADGPTLIRYPKGPVPANIPAVRKVHTTEILVEAPDPARSALIVCVGSLASTALQVQENLSKNGILASVVDPCWILPIADSLVDLATQYQAVYTLEDGLADGGFGSGLRDRLGQGGHNTPIQCFGAPKEFLATATIEQLQLKVGLDVASLTDSIATHWASLAAG